MLLGYLLRKIYMFWIGLNDSKALLPLNNRLSVADKARTCILINPTFVIAEFLLGIYTYIETLQTKEVD